MCRRVVFSFRTAGAASGDIFFAVFSFFLTYPFSHDTQYPESQSVELSNDAPGCKESSRMNGWNFCPTINRVERVVKSVRFIAALLTVGILALGLTTQCPAQSTFGRKLGPQSSQPGGDLAANSGGAKSVGSAAGGGM